MKKDKSNKRSAAENAVEKPVPSTQAPVETPESKPQVEVRSIDPELEEIVQDERGENYLRKTPKGMFEEAEAEANQRELADYRYTISLLRQKGFSFREIGEFLTKRGVFADHNAVYRIYTKFMTPDEIEEENRIEAEEREREME